jgi:hypothetical protein
MTTESSETTTTSLEEVDGYKGIMGDEVSSPTMLGEDDGSLGLDKFSLDDRGKSRKLERIQTNLSPSTSEPSNRDDQDDVQIAESPTSDTPAQEELQDDKTQIVESPSAHDSPEQSSDTEQVQMVESPISESEA